MALGEIQTLFRWGAMGSWTDSQLVTLFLTGQEGSEAAFRTLIHRHGPMVLGVCRRILGDEHAAEDAFQATFLVLVKKARTLRDRDLLTNWLYGVALRVASRERARGARRRLVEQRAAGTSLAMEGEHDRWEIRSVIDEEIRRLPERYRVPLLLCHVEGLRHEEVARRLGCPVGTVESRLSRARQQLRSRLERRGLAPSAWATGSVLLPPESGLLPSLVEATVRAAADPAAGAGVGIRVALGSVSSVLPRIARLGTGMYTKAGAVATAMVVVIGIAAAGLGVLRVDGETPRLEPQLAPPSGDPPRETRSTERERDDTIRPQRSASAVARPLSGITIDGRLDDWPKDLEWYPIEHHLLKRPETDGESPEPTQDPEAIFRVGYDRQTGLIYLAVVVRDDRHVVPPDGAPEGANVYKADAVEVYIDGAYSDRKIPEPSGDWSKSLDAAKMPVLQYAGIAGRVAAYGDKWGANPSLVYARTRETRTRMKSRRDGDITTYEWAIQAYDRFPDRRTELVAGKRIGLDVAVVDKDDRDGLSAWMYWGPPYKGFKGCDASNLGELILAEGR
jgi:RNA polymerase sigma factor (sigma-70 family)